MRSVRTRDSHYCVLVLVPIRLLLIAVIHAPQHIRFTQLVWVDVTCLQPLFLCRVPVGWHQICFILTPLPHGALCIRWAAPWRIILIPAQCITGARVLACGPCGLCTCGLCLLHHIYSTGAS